MVHGVTGRDAGHAACTGLRVCSAGFQASAARGRGSLLQATTGVYELEPGVRSPAGAGGQTRGSVDHGVVLATGDSPMPGRRQADPEPDSPVLTGAQLRGEQARAVRGELLA